MVKWYRFDKLLAGLRDGGAGAWPPRVMFKALLLQSLYEVSDREMEEALADRLSFRRFAELGLKEPVPDHGAEPVSQSADRAKACWTSCLPNWTAS